MHPLRDYQEDVVKQIVAAREGGAQSVLLISSTGSGKTRMISSTVARLGLHCASFAHRREIVQQIKHAMHAAGVVRHQEFGVTSVKAAGAARSRYFNAMFFDEAHHIAAPSYQALLRHGKGKFILGATATPYRTDGTKIHHWFDAVVVAENARSLASRGFLAQVEYFSASQVDFAGVKKNLKQDFDTRQALERIRISVQAGDVLQAWQTIGLGGPALIYCISRAHCAQVAQELSEGGRRVAIVTAATKASERNAILAQFEARQIDAVINCEIFTEGTDIKGVEVIIMLRPTLSRGLYKQMIGRGLRPDCNCIVIDHVGNYQRHGDVLNEDPLEIMHAEASVPQYRVHHPPLVAGAGEVSLHIEKIEANMCQVWAPAVFRRSS